MKNIVLLLILSLSLSCAQKRRKDKEVAYLHLQIGTKHLTQKNYRAALTEFLTAAELDPKDPITHNNLGLTYFVLGDNENSRDQLTTAVELDPNYSEARSNLGRVLSDMGNHSRAIEHFDIVIKDLTYPHPERAWVNLGMAYFRLKKYSQAKKSFQRAISLDKTYCPAYIYFGRSIFEERHFSKAAEALDRAAQICREEAFEEAQYFAAMAYFKLGEKEKAVARMEEIVELRPKSLYAKKSKEMLSKLR